MKHAIGLDYDDTFSLNPLAWQSAMKEFTERGWAVYGITARNRNQYIDCPYYWETCESVLYCAGRAKKPTAAEFGINIQVWIDDHPDRIHQHWPGVVDLQHSLKVYHPILITKEQWFNGKVVD